ncbi:hypothetical protein KY359_04070 [Candidatus Woesearchaeota archaeon]|nr:hypothetical protein [Candidatus Woesearchaeota archaeon]
MVWYASVGLYFWELFKTWITTIFIAPFKTTDMLWLLVPVWAAWFFAEFFQEKHGTSMGNAITNAVVVIWGSVDCTRRTVFLITSGTVTGLMDIISRFAIIAAILTYGVVIVTLGLKGNKIIKYIGRVREVTYAFAMFVPVLYNEMPLTINHVIAALLFFPLFYFAIEVIDRYTPNPKAVVEDMEESEAAEGSKGLGGGFGEDKGGGLGDLGGGLGGGKGGDDFGDLKL